VYAVAQLPDSLPLRAQCLALVAPDDAVICDRHCGLVAGAEMVLAPNEHLEVVPVSDVSPHRAPSPKRMAISGERSLWPEDITEVMGIPVSTMLRTAWTLAVSAHGTIVSAMDQMLRLPRFPVD
jgi:hypothetical protein